MMKKKLHLCLKNYLLNDYLKLNDEKKIQMKLENLIKIVIRKS